MFKKILNILFVVAIIGALLAGFAKTLLFPHDINTYENRYAEKIAPVSAESFLDGSFQNSMDAALSDQVPFAQYCKKFYNVSRSLLQEKLLVPLAQSAPDRYINFFQIRMFGGTHLTYHTNTLAAKAESLAATADSHNALFAAYPDTDFYLYYIENDTDINFETGEKVLAFEYLRDRIQLPEDHVGHFPVDDFETFSQYFYRTDHHWNYAGSYAAYCDILSLLGVSEPALEPVKTATVGSITGSKANESGADTFSEPFIAYQFAFPAMSITINGSAAADYGNQNAFFEGSAGVLSYGNFYGGDSGEIMFDTGTTDRGSILLIGESHDNAILKLLASHFDRTYSIDLRNYTHFMGREFVLGEYLEQHNIDKVLFIGSNGFYASETFRLEG